MTEPKPDLTNQLETMDQLTETFFKYKYKLVEKKYKTHEYKLNNTKVHVLKTIYNQKTCMVADVSRKLDLTSGATTILLNQLEEDGFVVRLRSEEDRRIVWLSLSDRGREIIEGVIETRNQFLIDMLGSLSDEERGQFFRLLGKIEKRLREKLSNPPE